MKQGAGLMVGDRVNRYARDVATLFAAGKPADLGDAELLDRFLDHEIDRQAAELAFAALVERHGPMVLRACLGVLGDVHEAQDVSQATFLVLARRAGSVRRRGSVASWLHGVAFRLSAKVRRGRARRRSHERRGGELMMARQNEQSGRPPAESWPELHEELGRLPERYREPIILCHLEGLTQQQAALRLGWPIGTVQSRLARGRERMREGLNRRGIPPTAGTLSVGLGPAAEAVVGAAWVESTARAAVQVAAGRAIAGSFPAAVLRLCESGSRSLQMIRLGIAGGVVATIGAMAAAWSAPGRAVQEREPLAAVRSDPPPRAAAGPEAAPPPDEPAAEQPPSLAGRWVVLYMTGTSAGRREAYVEPNLLVPITDDAINLPTLTGNDRDPIHFRGYRGYATERRGILPTIEVVEERGPGGARSSLHGIYRLAGDNLVICYDSEPGRLPASFAAGRPTETLLILRRERPAAVRRPDSSPPPPTNPTR